MACHGTSLLTSQTPLLSWRVQPCGRCPRLKQSVGVCSWPWLGTKNTSVYVCGLPPQLLFWSLRIHTAISHEVTRSRTPGCTVISWSNFWYLDPPQWFPTWCAVGLGNVMFLEPMTGFLHAAIFRASDPREGQGVLHGAELLANWDTCSWWLLGERNTGCLSASPLWRILCYLRLASIPNDTAIWGVYGSSSLYSFGSGHARISKVLFVSLSVCVPPSPLPHKAVLIYALT